MNGWISLHRQIQDNWLWKDKPFSKGQAWIDLLLLVNHEDNKILIDGELMLVKRGQRVTSIRQLADRWGWSRHKVDDFLKLLETDKMLEQNRDSKKTVVTIQNYDNYQDSKNTKEPPKSHQRASHEPVTDTNNNDNNYNNDNKDIPLKKELKIFTIDDKEYLLAKYLSKQISERLSKPLREEKDLQKWSTDFEKMVRLDKLDINEIKEVLMFSQKNKFWQNNILSASKFRKQYLTLLSQMLSDDKKGGEDSGKYGNRIQFNVPKVEREDTIESYEDLGLI